MVEFRTPKVQLRVPRESDELAKIIKRLNGMSNVGGNSVGPSQPTLKMNPFALKRKPTVKQGS